MKACNSIPPNSKQSRRTECDWRHRLSDSRGDIRLLPGDVSQGGALGFDLQLFAELRSELLLSTMLSASVILRHSSRGFVPQHVTYMRTSPHTHTYSVLSAKSRRRPASSKRHNGTKISLLSCDLRCAPLVQPKALAFQLPLAVLYTPCAQA